MEAGQVIDPQQYLPLVKSIVDRMDVRIPESWDKDDMVGYGILGLLEAVGRFQPEKGIQFATFASKRIKGAILDALRKDSPLSRNCWQKVQLITEAMERISAATGKEASIHEIVREVNLDQAEVEQTMQSFKLLASISLEQTLGINELRVKDTLKGEVDKSPEEMYLEDEQAKILSEAVSMLEERQKLVLSLYYYEELTLKEIAAALDVSVSRVSQLKTMALTALRSRLSSVYL
ncbi:MAG: FliA/WhiG family RNA polymerase sigma factor [Syntrophomonadaceae bacterium]|nr:FliA/WhiG family RNA polymerase sigma factor [Syntrophomonadaceae bacterium]